MTDETQKRADEITEKVNLSIVEDNTDDIKQHLAWLDASEIDIKSLVKSIYAEYQLVNENFLMFVFKFLFKKDSRRKILQLFDALEDLNHTLFHLKWDYNVVEAPPSKSEYVWHTVLKGSGDKYGGQAVCMTALEAERTLARNVEWVEKYEVAPLKNLYENLFIEIVSIDKPKFEYISGDYPSVKDGKILPTVNELSK